MRRLILSMMFCVGVALAMTASPADMCDDDNAAHGNVQPVTAVSDLPTAPVNHGRFKFKVKKNIDFSKLKDPNALSFNSLQKPVILRMVGPLSEVHGGISKHPLGGIHNSGIKNDGKPNSNNSKGRSVPTEITSQTTSP